MSWWLASALFDVNCWDKSRRDEKESAAKPPGPQLPTLSPLSSWAGKPRLPERAFQNVHGLLLTPCASEKLNGEGFLKNHMMGSWCESKPGANCHSRSRELCFQPWKAVLIWWCLTLLFLACSRHPDGHCLAFLWACRSIFNDIRPFLGMRLLINSPPSPPLSEKGPLALKNYRTQQ